MYFKDTGARGGFGQRRRKRCKQDVQHDVVMRSPKASGRIELCSTMTLRNRAPALRSTVFVLLPLHFIFGILKLGNDLHKAVNVVKIAVNRSEADVRDVVDLLELVKSDLADLVGGDFALEGIFQFGRDILDDIFDGLQLDGALNGGSAKPVHQLFAVERLYRMILFNDHQRDLLDDLIGSKTGSALDAFAAAAHLVVGRAGVYDLAFLTAAFGTFHNIFLLKTIVRYNHYTTIFCTFQDFY